MKTIALLIGLMFITSSASMNFTINGTVNDIYGNPLPGVVIQIKGTSQRTISDINGTFSIHVTDSKATLVFSYEGYVSQEIRVTGPDYLTVVLTDDAVSPEEVVVVGYATEKKADLTGAVSVMALPAAGQTFYHVPRYRPVPEYNTEGYSVIHENGFKNPLREPLSTFSIDVDAASYSNVRRFISQGQKPVQDAVRIEEMINYFDYDYPQPGNGHPFSIVYESGECPWNQDNLLLHIGLQGEKISNDEVPPSNIVFLIDVSGSMDAPNKLPLLKNAMKLLVGQLRPTDRVAIVVYAGSSGLVLPSTPGDQKARIISALERLHAGGSTAGAAGLKLAYEVADRNFIRDGNNRIILATDGDFNVGPSSNAEMERMIESYRNKGIFISVTGFGIGNYKDDKMEIIADKGNGNYAYIDNLMEAKKVFINEFTSTLYTIAKDVKIQIEFNPAYVKEYRLIGYENRLLDEEDFEDDRKDAGEMGAGHSVTALYEIVPATDGSKPERNLKYQQSDVNTDAAGNHELATIHFRYKKPDSDTSTLLTEVIPDRILSLERTSDNFRFSAAVAGFGMLLRDSEFAGTMDVDKVLAMARASRGADEDGYRSEFIRLVELSKSLLLSSNDKW
ncbi:MAG: von Willebrand factor type A domain-containing protein [Bacteroidales bacterium]|nr:von Willebrand factor type A domain-containing protein [Bacteroidales bacterium]